MDSFGLQRKKRENRMNGCTSVLNKRAHEWLVESAEASEDRKCGGQKHERSKRLQRLCNGYRMAVIVIVFLYNSQLSSPSFAVHLSSLYPANGGEEEEVELNNARLMNYHLYTSFVTVLSLFLFILATTTTQRERRRKCSVVFTSV